MKSIRNLSLITLFLIASSTLITSCKKEQATVVKINVVNELNIAQTNANVRLFPNPSPALGQMISEDVSFTNEKGVCYFDYSTEYNRGQAGFRLLDVEVITDDGLSGGVGIIKVIEEEVNEVTIIVSPI